MNQLEGLEMTEFDSVGNFSFRVVPVYLQGALAENFEKRLNVYTVLVRLHTCSKIFGIL